MATPPHVPPKPPQQPDPRQSQREREEREAREKHEHEAREKREASAKEEAQRREKGEAEDDRHKGDEQKGKPKYPILAEGQAYQLFFNGHKIVRDGDPPHQWLMMSRLPDSTPVVQTPMTEELEKKLKEGKFYLADGITEEPQQPQPRRDPL